MKTLRRAGFSLLLAGTLLGCAAYEKCGFKGCAGDAQIAADVRAAFDRYSALSPPNLLTVQAINRVVYLYGTLDTDMHRDLASNVAKHVRGVAKVENAIGLSGIR